MPRIPDSLNVPPPSPAEPPRASPGFAEPQPAPAPPPPAGDARITPEQAAELRAKLGFKKVSLRSWEVDPKQVAEQLFPGALR